MLTVPVYGNNPGEPCNAGTFAASDCNGKPQAWRWNLDYVQDIHGNTMSYWWAKETNYYAKNLTGTTPVVYDRAGYLTRIDYGSDNRDDNEYAATSPYIENVPGRIEFTNVDRCLQNCTTKNATNWPDTPGPELHRLDQPVHQRLSHVLVRKAHHGDHHQGVEGVRLGLPEGGLVDLPLRVLDPGDGTRAGLWLEGITHKGLNGGTITTPEVTFSGIQMPNRVDAGGSDWALAMNWHRVNLITLETGGQIFVTYKQPQCVRGSVMPSKDALDKNKLLCYPVEWAPNGRDKVTDFFHKYVVEEVQQIDPTGGSRPLRTAYEYLNTNNEALWHHDDDTGITPNDRRTWSQWRGFPRVVTYVGEGPARTKTETLYYRGMYGDKLANGSTRTTQVQGLEGGAVNDYDHFSGSPRETITWLDGNVLSATVYTMWRSEATATRAGSPVAESRYTRVRTVSSRTATDSGWRRSTSTTDFDDYGMPTTQEDSPDGGATGDKRCSKTEYIRNANRWLLTPVKRIHGWVGRAPPRPPTPTRSSVTSGSATTGRRTARRRTRGCSPRARRSSTLPAATAPTSRWGQPSTTFGAARPRSPTSPGRRRRPRTSRPPVGRSPSGRPPTRCSGPRRWTSTRPPASAQEHRRQQLRHRVHLRCPGPRPPGVVAQPAAGEQPHHAVDQLCLHAVEDGAVVRGDHRGERSRW